MIRGDEPFLRFSSMKAAFCSSFDHFLLNAYTAPVTAATVPATPVTRPLARILCHESSSFIFLISQPPKEGHIFLTDLCVIIVTKNGNFSRKKDENKIIVIVGPTAVGKTDLAIEVAQSVLMAKLLVVIVSRSYRGSGYWNR